MNPEQPEQPNQQRAAREITYREGWKRKTITRKGEAPAPPSGQARPLSFPESSTRTWGLLWREAPAPRGILKVSIVILPAVIFVVFVWMVYELSRYSF
ncbi:MULTISPECIES: hypothetical protein [unclassified Paenibacillus]|uniref:hypothetical protein n=1 Tax=unclassified Paenibacillus TaxID=185978 RepID=UPI001AE2F460|nr:MULTISPECIES: hypothetical protein [unclassified Paenibacillus]MBP1154813.1 hypothetical protein [Paenibacillus sp. PvP091]MBP1169803.1 hypothetical protein [Paenibacillus sp. PvR098]MBP2440831.1 hypothetical protein [Paenibacillus sp. PvP052]